MNKSSLYILIILFSFLSFNCNKNKNTYDEGELTYAVTYIGNKYKNPIIELLPRKIKIRVKNNNSVIYVIGFFNTFEMRIITNYDKGKSYTLLRIFDKKYYASVPLDSLAALYEDFNNMKIHYTDDTVTIAGFLSYKANIECKTLDDSLIPIYYTKQLKLKNPNYGTPYKDIDGVLTLFQTKLAGIDMIFQLIDFKPIQISDSEFEIEKDYKKVNKNDLIAILKSFQQ